MEFEKFEEVYQVLEAQKEKDETAAELYADVKEFAYKYATMRYRFSEMSREEKAENDSYRTSQHNRFMDSVRIYFRYLQNNGVNVPDFYKSNIPFSRAAWHGWRNISWRQRYRMPEA